MGNLEFVIIIVIGLLMLFGFFKLTWNIGGTGVDIMSFFGNAGRPGTLREEGYRNSKKVRKDFKWNEDGSKQ